MPAALVKNQSQSVFCASCSSFVLVGGADGHEFGLDLWRELQPGFQALSPFGLAYSSVVMNKVTRILDRVQQGDPKAGEELLRSRDLTYRSASQI